MADSRLVPSKDALLPVYTPTLAVTASGQPIKEDLAIMAHFIYCQTYSKFAEPFRTQVCGEFFF